MDIRKATPEDASRISELLQSLAKKFILPTCEPQVHAHLLASMSEQAIQQNLQDGFLYLVIDGPDQQLIATAGLRDRSHLYHLFVHENFGKQGIARQLWQAILHETLTSEHNGEFTVNSALHAEGLYRKLGFARTEGIRHRHGMVDIPMKLTIDLRQWRTEPSDTHQLTSI